jgi:hypothetical protein
VPDHDHFIDPLYESALEECENIARPIVDKALPGDLPEPPWAKSIEVCAIE